MQIACYEHWCWTHLTLIIVDRFAINRRSVGENRDKDALSGVQSARVEPNLETATYNNDPRPAATQIRRGLALEAVPGVPRNYECVSPNASTCNGLALQFNGASICHLSPRTVPGPASAKMRASSRLFNIFNPRPHASYLEASLNDGNFIAFLSYAYTLKLFEVIKMLLNLVYY